MKTVNTQTIVLIRAQNKLKEVLQDMQDGRFWDVFHQEVRTAQCIGVDLRGDVVAFTSKDRYIANIMRYRNLDQISGVPEGVVAGTKAESVYGWSVEALQDAEWDAVIAAYNRRRTTTMIAAYAVIGEAE
ncbi:MAG: hypothetical protein NC548_06460 [Lachnospiraceae bacterium]|nr:hypothetical protein [Lachnospiraceae bacterium]